MVVSDAVWYKEDGKTIIITTIKYMYTNGTL